MDEKVQQAEKAKTALDQWKQKYNMQTMRSAKGVSEILEELSDLGNLGHPFFFKRSFERSVRLLLDFFERSLRDI